MEFYELIRKRESIRNYTDRQIEEEKLKKILEAARLAPSAANKQPWEFLVIRSKELLEAIKRTYPKGWFIKAPCIIVVKGDKNQSWMGMTPLKQIFLLQ